MNFPPEGPGSPGLNVQSVPKVTVPDLRSVRGSGRKIVMLTAYDYPTARILDTAGVDVLLVGDSLGNNVLGYESTLPVTMEEMLHRTRNAWGHEVFGSRSGSENAKHDHQLFEDKWKTAAPI